MTGIEQSQLCRVCLQSQISKGISLFKNYKYAPIFEHINLLAKLEINKDDGLPDKICTICLMELDTVLNFIQKCRNSDFILKNAPAEIKLEHSLADEDQEELIKDEVSDNEQACDDTRLLDDDIYERILTDEIIPKKPAQTTFECHDCGNLYQSKCKLRVHWKRVHLLDQLVCKICKKQCKTYRSLHSHMKRGSNACLIGMKVNIIGIGKNRMYHCKDCEYKSKQPNSMMHHSKTHSGDRPFVCKICSKTFTQSSSLSGHMEAVHKQYKREITCQYCGKHIKGRTSIYRHLKIHESQKVKCEICSKVMKSKKYLDIHMLRHSGSKTITCELCAKSFYTSGELSTHKRIKHDVIKVENKKKTIFSCNICAFKCARNETLKRHTLKHTDSNVCCVTCGSFFDNVELWRVHQKRHLDLKYKCPECDKRFFARKSIWTHVRNIHKHPYSTVKYKKICKKPKTEGLNTLHNEEIKIECSVSQ